MATATQPVILTPATDLKVALGYLSSGEITMEAYQEWDAQRIRSAQQKPAQSFSMKVSEKGCISIRGLRGANVKFGFTAYVSTIEDLFASREKIEAFIKQNNHLLARK